MAKVFLSYAREDAPAAKELAECIGRAGHHVWWDRQIQGGTRFATEIDRELKGAQAVVVLWSGASIDSAWVQDEAAEGRDSGRLVPVAMGGCRPPLGFRQFHTVDLGDWAGAGEPKAVDDVLEAIEKIAGDGAANGATETPAQAETKPGASICVLPFVNMSGDPEQEYFSDGITVDIITDLSKVSALFVIARNTAFTFKGKVMDVKEAARSLNVSHVLEGSVRKAGSRVRITAQLIDSETGGHLWAERYDRDLTDIFAIQDEISKAIVQALRVKLLPSEKKAIETRGTSNIEAYNLYLMARQQWINGDYSDIRRDESIVRICKQALSFDPNYAQAWAMMAFAQAVLRFQHGKDVDPRVAAEKAIEINPQLAEPHAVLAQLHAEQGKTDDANHEVQEALRLDPESWEVNREAARIKFRQGRIADAIPLYEKSASLVPTDWHSPMMLTTCYQSIDDDDAVRRCARSTIERAEKAVAKDPANTQALAGGANALAILGEGDRARDWIDRALLLDPDNTLTRYNLACALALRLNDAERAIQVMEPYFEQENSLAQFRHLEVDPDMDPIRDDPRFKKMLAAAKQRVGIA